MDIPYLGDHVRWYQHHTNRFRQGPETSKPVPKINNLDTSIFKNMNMIIWIIAGPLSFSGRLITLTFLPSHGTFLGLSDNQVAWLIAIDAISNFFGRLSIGIIGDMIGNVNTYFISMLLTTLSIFVLWMLAYSFETLLIFAIVYGVVSGGYAVLSAPVAVDIVGVTKYPSAMNFTMLFHALDILLPVFASHQASRDIGSGDPFWAYKVIAGVRYTICTMCAIVLKLRMSSRWDAKV
ncbi:major facilitator superfamily domain-containing protein [Fennellomyces sp. T-0311]|nr:major facilitator superfamily domain-containing protein [Fennellomyces sp. T-0311]